jgi:hypothetical protein
VGGCTSVIVIIVAVAVVTAAVTTRATGTVRVFCRFTGEHIPLMESLPAGALMCCSPRILASIVSA